MASCIEDSIIVKVTQDKEIMKVSLKSLIISKQIQNTVLKYNPDFNFDDYLIEDDGTFPLNKIDSMLNDELYGKKDRPPIYVKKSGEFMIIMNGRHRVARALILNMDDIEVKVQ